MAESESTESVEEASDAIESMQPASGWMARSTVVISRSDKPEDQGCTGVIIAPRFILTAAHCTTDDDTTTIGDRVLFYTDDWINPFDADARVPRTDPVGTICDYWLPSGVHEPNKWDIYSDYTDDDGLYADLAILELESNVPSPSMPAQLPLSYPGNNAHGFMVGGSRKHYDHFTGLADLRSYYDKFYSSNDNDGHFLVDSDNVNGGDSGGPFYLADLGDYYDDSTIPVVQGIASAKVFEWASHAKYTSVRRHLSWILDTIDFPASNQMTLKGGFIRAAQTYKSIMIADPKVCALACYQDSQCKSYSHIADPIMASYSLCHLHQEVGTEVANVRGTTGKRP